MTIAQAWERMLEHSIKAMPVVNEKQQVVGILTDEDLIHRAGLQQHLSVAARLDQLLHDKQLAALRDSALRVVDVMTRPVITASSSESLGIGAARLVKHSIKRLPVVDGSGKLVGVVARVDILRQAMDMETKTPKLHIPGGAALSVRQVMYADIPTVPAEADLAAIVSTLVETGMRRLVVVDAQNRPIGLISDSDVVSRIQPRQRPSVLDALRGGPAPSGDIRAEKLMSPGVLTAKPDMSLVEAAKTMLSQRRKWLVVVDERGKAIGLVDRQILLGAMTCG